jgi:undecaprenyl-diphosphatase
MRRAILLGLLQGPTELAPVSSSAHTALLWRHEEAAFAKSLQVALHGGTACALALSTGGELRRTFARIGAGVGRGAAPRSATRRKLSTLALAAGPPALVGAAMERPIERRLGGSRSIAAGLLLGSLAMAFADGQPQTRAVEQADLGDGLALGLAQAAALMPGVSRRGATLAAARARGFRRADADALSWLVALPVLAGACVLKAARLRCEPPAPEQRRALAAGMGASSLSTLIAAQMLSYTRLSRAPLAPFCVYRIALAGALLVVRPHRGSP